MIRLALIVCAVLTATTSLAQSPSDPTSIASQAAQANVINWNTIILAFISLLTTIATTVGGIYLVKIKAGQDGLVSVTNDTHTLVNSKMGVQLKITYLTAMRIAQLTKSPDDVAAAEIAKLAYDEHVEKQALVDSRGGVIGGGRNA